MTKTFSVGLLLMRRYRVVDSGVDATVKQALLEGGAFGNADDEEVPNVGLLAGPDEGQADAGVHYLAAIASGDFSAPGVVCVEVRQLHAEKRSLHFIKAVVRT